jgi:glycosyltransferase involved in cell wall biosynthesis
MALTVPQVITRERAAFWRERQEDSCRTLRVLLVHNSYQQPGGEDAVFEQERQLLEAAGHEVLTYLRSNNEIHDYSVVQRIAMTKQAVWASSSRDDLVKLVRVKRPDIVHIHNTFPLISPAVYYACAESNVSVIQTLHNYRLLCLGATLFRDGHPCEACLGKAFPWDGIAHACYRGSHCVSATVAVLLGVHRALRTWTMKVDAFIAPSEFVKEKFIQGGFPAEKIFVKPNFVSPDPCPNGCLNSASRGEYAVFVGRLSEEKGLRTLLAAWKRLGCQIPLRIVGDGPMRNELEASAKDLTKISSEGSIPREAVFEVLRRARFLIFPSECYETFGCVLTESFAFGVPAIVSRLGSMKEIVQDGVSGLHFNPGDADDLAAKVLWAWAHPMEMQAMGRNARTKYEAKYSAERNYKLLMEIYNHVLAGSPRHPAQAGQETLRVGTSNVLLNK